MYAGNVREGDWLAGDVDQDSPEHPVQLFDRALHITAVRVVPGDRGKYDKRVLMTSGSRELAPKQIGKQCLVIRG
jgi:hypothetical protein